MAFKLEDVLKGENLLTTAAVGVGLYILAPVAGQVLRPLAKTVIRGGIVAYDWTASTAAEAMQRAPSTWRLAGLPGGARVDSRMG